MLYGFPMQQTTSPKSVRRYHWQVDYQITDPHGTVQDKGLLEIVAATPDEARQLAQHKLSHKLPKLYIDWTLEISTEIISVADADSQN